MLYKKFYISLNDVINFNKNYNNKLGQIKVDIVVRQEQLN